MAQALERGGARLYAQKYIISGIRQGLSGNQILQNLQSVSFNGVSLGYATQTFYADYNRYLNASTAPTLRGLPSLPGGQVQGFTFTSPTRAGTRFMYTQELRGRNSTTGEISRQNISIVSPFPILPQFQQQALVNAFDSNQYGFDLLPTQTSDITEYQFQSSLI